jgi:hypothetical protein
MCRNNLEVTDMPAPLVAFLWGAAGGVIAEGFKWFQLRDSANLPAYRASPFYWGVTLVMILIGGVLAIAYNASTNPILAINIGISAPLIIKMLAGSNPVTAPPVIPAPSPPPGPRTTGEGPPPQPQPGSAALAVAPIPAASPIAFLAGR